MHAEHSKLQPLEDILNLRWATGKWKNNVSKAIAFNYTGYVI